MKYELKQGDNAETLKQYPDNYFDSIVTDPPYGIEFLGKDWDKNTGVMETWNECFRVLKPGGHLLAFSAARTYHHLATNIESAGFEIRDQLMWLYGSGFPKAQDIGKAIDKREIENDWHGWKTALKPAHEPIVMARKPFKGSAIDNVLEHGVGAMNIDESRVPYADEKPVTTHSKKSYKSPSMAGEVGALETHSAPGQELGRYPSNVIMDEEAGQILDEQAPKSGNVSSSKRTKTGMTGSGHSLAWHKNAGESNGISDGLSGASKFFYCPKVSRAERHIGFEQTQANKRPRGEAFGDGNLLTDSTKSLGNNHPTVKPVELMKYLVKLVTPAGGKVLDPFNGSGSTGMACVELGYEFLGCELDPDYIEIATKRIEGWYEHTRPDTNFDELFEK